MGCQWDWMEEWDGMIYLSHLFSYFPLARNLHLSASTDEEGEEEQKGLSSETKPAMSSLSRPTAAPLASQSVGQSAARVD